ncbi:MAG: flagellar basal body rod protein FlgB [Lachnospiraceae bacterium]|nr:flagellar basal body rod protein FlgB [Lachnospiraceae bacterium]
MVNSHVFSYINVLDKAADAAWLRNEAISNNLANVDTPGYKRQDVAFEDELIRNLNKVEYDTMDARVYNMKLSRIEPRVYTDASAYSYRLDGNNVDIDTENVYLAENQVTYNALTQCIKSEFSNLRTAMGTGSGG